MLDKNLKFVDDVENRLSRDGCHVNTILMLPVPWFWRSWCASFAQIRMSSASEAESSRGDHLRRILKLVCPWQGQGHEHASYGHQGSSGAESHFRTELFHSWATGTDVDYLRGRAIHGLPVHDERDKH